MNQLMSVIETHTFGNEKPSIRPIEDLYDIFDTDPSTKNPLKLPLITIFDSMENDPDVSILSPEDLSTIDGEWKYCTTYHTENYENHILERDMDISVYENVYTLSVVGIFKIIIDENNPDESPISLAYKAKDYMSLMEAFDSFKEVNYGYLTVNGIEILFTLSAEILWDYVYISMDYGEGFDVKGCLETTQDLINAINERFAEPVTALRLVY